MPEPEDYSYQRYLEAKKSIDDRAINQRVWKTLKTHLHSTGRAEPISVLEIGSGVGTMIERVVDWELIKNAKYTAVDLLPANIDRSRKRLLSWAESCDLKCETHIGDQFHIFGNDISVSIEFKESNFYSFAENFTGKLDFDLIIASAFLDLVDFESVVPLIFTFLHPGGLFYFPLNFDGVTILEPMVDPFLDSRIISLYHRTMDERLTDGAPSGDSRTGRKLFGVLNSSLASILEVGSSDWIVYPRKEGYYSDEVYFLHFIIHTINESLTDHPELTFHELNKWALFRHAQIERGELVYIAHQLDFVGKV